MYEVKHVLSVNGVDIYQAWLDTVQDTRSKARITTRVDRAALGHFGITEPVGDGVFEMTLYFGPGFRVYYAIQDRKNCFPVGRWLKGQTAERHPSGQGSLEILQGAAKMTIRTRSHEDSVLEMLRNDEAFALEYLSVALEEIDEAGGEDAFLVAVRRVAEARGGMLSLSQNTGLNRANLYRSIAVGGDPKLSTLLKVLQALGVGMSKVVSHRTEQDVRA